MLSEMPVSDVTADMSLVDRRPAKVSTTGTAEVTPRLLLEEDDSTQQPPATFRSSSSWFAADAQVGRDASPLGAGVHDRPRRVCACASAGPTAPPSCTPAFCPS